MSFKRWAGILIGMVAGFYTFLLLVSGRKDATVFIQEFFRTLTGGVATKIRHWFF